MNIRGKLIVIFLFISVVPFGTLGFFVYEEGEELLRVEIFNHLSDIADSKQKIIKDWFKERFKDTELMAHNMIIEENLLELLKIRDEYEKKDLPPLKYAETLKYKRILSYLELTIRQHGVFSEIYILDPITGTVILSTDRSHLGTDESASDSYKKVVTQGHVFIKDVYFSDRWNQPVMTYSDVIYFLGGKGSVAGVLVSDLKVKEVLEPLIEGSIGMGRTGETVLVNKNNITLLDLKHRPDSALKFQVPVNTPARLASAGQDGIVEGKDYRGKNVLAAYRYIPDLNWGLIAKIDLDEAYAPIHKFLKIVVIFTILGIVVILFLISFVSKRATSPLITMTRIAHEISNGNYRGGKDYHVRRSDEIGDLAKAIKGMSEELDREQSNVSRYKKELELKIDEITENSTHLNKTYLELKETKSYLERIIDHSKDLIITTNTDGRIMEFNREAQERLGYKKEEVIHKPVSILWLIPEERKEMTTLVGQLGVVRNKEVRMLDKGGGVHDVSLTLSLLKNEKGEDVGTVGISRDISEQKMLHYKLVQSEKMAGLGTLASGIAHEINNPLGGILGMAEAILDEDDSETTKSYAKDIVNYSLEAASIVKELSIYSRSAADESVSGIDLALIMENSIRMAKRSIRFTLIEVTQNMQKGCWLNANAGEIQQVFVNLAINAIHSMGTKGGRLTMSCFKEGQFVRSSVADTGAGIKGEHLNRIYDPFFTTKPPGKGTGLGLYVAYKIVTKYSGQLEVISKEGKGTTFNITFPIEINASRRESSA